MHSTDRAAMSYVIRDLNDAYEREQDAVGKLAYLAALNILKRRFPEAFEAPRVSRIRTEW
jgi:hypothetical protein